MKAAPIPHNEVQRLSALLEYNILDTLPEKEYDDITRIAADICKTPISTISLIDRDRQWFKSRFGHEPAEGPRDTAFCAHAILTPEEIFTVPDATADDRFFDNPLVIGFPNIAFYAGFPLVNETGSALGTLCVIDHKPRELSPPQKETMKALARQVVAYFEVRKKTFLLTKQKEEIEQLNSDLSRFAHIVAHDVKSPYSSLAMSAMFLRDAYGKVLDADAMMMLGMMENTSKAAIEMVDGILQHTLKTAGSEVVKDKFLFGTLIGQLRQLLVIPAGFTFQAINEGFELYTSKSILQQILINLCNNAIKYNDKENGRITVSVEDNDSEYSFVVADNGPGISPANQARVFDLFTTLGVPDRYKKQGTGIGLATVQRLVHKMGGRIKIESQPGQGCSFIFSISK